MTEPLTISKLIEEYRSDPASPYHDVRYRTRENYDSLLRRIHSERGKVQLVGLKAAELKRWHRAWTTRGTSIAHSLMAMLRIIAGFGVTFLEDDDCARISVILGKEKFKQGKARTLHLSADQAEAICAEARSRGRPSVALQQALQYEGTLRQKDGIGEWIPVSEPGVSDVLWKRHGKWVRGARWNEVDDNLIFRHVTSKTGSLVEIDLKHAPMVMAELQAQYGAPLHRSILPASGPMIVNEKTGRPYLTHQFRRLWRQIATAAGVPKQVQNRDTRAGAITEAIESGASLEDARKAARHTTTAMTARYSRGDADSIARTMKRRAAHRVAQDEPGEECA